MKRKLFFRSALIPALLACGASAQVVNFHAGFNYALYGYIANFGFDDENELFAGQGAYPDPGNNIWNSFGNGVGPYNVQQAPSFYTGGPGAGGEWPQQYGNPGNPYAAYTIQYNPYLPYFCSGTNLFNFNTCTPAYTGNATSAGQISPVQLTGAPGGSIGYNYYFLPIAHPDYGYNPVTDGAPAFLFGNSTSATTYAPFLSTQNQTFILTNVPAGNTYGLYLYGANVANIGGVIFTPDSGNPHNGISATLNANNTGGAPPANFAEGQNFVIWENVMPQNVVPGTGVFSDGVGTITITCTPNPLAVGVGGTETDVNGIQLIFNPLPTEVGLNSASNVYLGQNASFAFSPVFADEATTAPSYEWQFSGNNGSTWGSVAANSTGVTTSNLTITNVVSKNAGLYRCMITDNVTHAVGVTPPSSLSILTSTLPNILQVGNFETPGDTIADVNNNNVYLPGNTIPPDVNMYDTNAEDGTLYQYENFGANGNSTTTGFIGSGPAGFMVTPVAGPTVVGGMRIFTSSTHPEADPADYTLLGSTDGITFTPISGGRLALPLARNAAGGPINISNEVLQEIDFPNTKVYSTYELLFTNVVNNALDTNGIQIAEVQLLASLGFAVNLSTVTNDAPACVPFTLSVTPEGIGPFTYQWVQNGTTVLQSGPSSNCTFTTLPGTNTYTVNLTGASGTITSSTATVVGEPNDFFVDLNTWAYGYFTDGPIPIYYIGSTNADDVYGLEFTDGDTLNNIEAATAFYGNALLYIGGFVANFTYVASDLGNGGGNGITFCLENQSPFAFGGFNGGNSLGYVGIYPSWAFEMNIFAGANGGMGIAFGTNGSTPDSAAGNAPYASTGPIVLNNGDPINVQLYYDGTKLHVWMSDPLLAPGPSIFTTNVTVNLPAILGESAAYVGMTGSAGEAEAMQIVTNFQYSFTSPPMVSSIEKGTTRGTVVVSWPISVSTLFTLYQSPTVRGPWTPADMSSLTQTGCDYQVTLTAGVSAQFYTLALYPPSP